MRTMSFAKKLVVVIAMILGLVGLAQASGEVGVLSYCSPSARP